MPHPADLEAYERIVPGADREILEQAREQGEHRRSLERRVVYANTTHQLIGLLGAIIISVTLIVAGVITTLHGFEWIGLIEALSGLVGTIAAAVYSIRQQQQERAAKRQEVQRRLPTRPS